MSITRVGIHTPDDVGDMIASVYDEDTGMTHEIHTCTDTVGALIGRWHEDVGLVTWFRADSIADARAHVAHWTGNPNLGQSEDRP